MEIVVCIDDTDNLDSRGTGELASLLAADLEANGWGRSRFITRHQLLVHPDIPYTSHNSAMCFAAEIDPTCHGTLISHAAAFLARESAENSDPGLCVVAVDQLADRDTLIAFGRLAKQSVLSKEDAYALAQRTGIHLSEHGGSGQGVIGALAGAGLRLSGNDGRLKGHLTFEAVNGAAAVAAIRSHADVDEVRALGGPPLTERDLVQLGEKVKTVLLDGRSVLLVVPASDTADGIAWQTCSKQQLRSY
jgi:tRNA(Ile2) C34 agmatinyltransferase TiaS